MLDLLGKGLHRALSFCFGVIFVLHAFGCALFWLSTVLLVRNFCLCVILLVRNFARAQFCSRMRPSCYHLSLQMRHPCPLQGVLQGQTSWGQ